MLTSQRQGLEGVAHPLKASDVHVSYVKGDEVLKGVTTIEVFEFHVLAFEDDRAGRR